jgi:alkylation response protein AidB-like acyl-CoA dehydrogenase
VTPALRRLITERAAEIERLRTLPRDLVDAMIDAGVFRLCVPKPIGGSECTPKALVAEILNLASCDGSVGWCAMIGATSGLAAAYLPQATAREIYASPRVVTGGVFAPRGRATPTDGGWRVSGRWPFASGCQHCDWLMLGGGALGADSKPELRMFMVPRAEVTIHDTWHVAGLAGTGSHDVEVADVVVPRAHSYSLITDRPWPEGPLYTLPPFGLLAAGIAAVAIGIGHGAVADFIELAVSRTPTLARRTLAERGQAQAALAEAKGLLAAGQQFLLSALDRVDTPPSLTERANIRLAATHATRTAAQAVTLLHHHAGGGSLYLSSSLQRRFRDVHAVTQHMMVGPATLELVGRIHFGLDTDTTML